MKRIRKRANSTQAALLAVALALHCEATLADDPAHDSTQYWIHLSSQSVAKSNPDVTSTFGWLTGLFSALTKKDEPCTPGSAADVAPPPDNPPVRDVACVKMPTFVEKPDFGHAPTQQSMSDFLDYITPIAMTIQQLTGYPSSVLTSQASIESNWGTSVGYQKRNNLFGLSCEKSEGGRWKVFPVSLDGANFQVQGVCRDKRPSPEGGYYLTFSSPIDSVLAYTSAVIQGRSQTFTNVAQALQSARDAQAQAQTEAQAQALTQARVPSSNGGSAVMDYRRVIPKLGPYATNPTNRNLIIGRITKNRLDRFDKLGFCDSDN